jgi:hypothetical protein
MVFHKVDFVYAQFLENSGNNGTNSSEFLSNSTESSNATGMVLLSQKLNNASFGYRVLDGMIQNKGNDTAKYVIVKLTVYDKNNSIVGSQFTYPHVRTFRPDLKSTFKMTSSIDNFKGMKYYEISLEWKKTDGSQGYLENAKIFKQKAVNKSK